MENTNKQKSTKIRYLVITSLFAGLICLTTAYILHIPLGGNNGYIHIGDTFIYLAATLLPTRYAMICAAIGAGLADLVSGAAVWVIPTIMIKPILVLFITSKKKDIINTRNIIGSFIGGFVSWFLYLIAKGIITGSFATALVFSSIELLQPIGSFIVFIIIGKMFDKLGIKDKV